MQRNVKISICVGRKLRGHTNESADAVGNCKSFGKLILAKRSFLLKPLNHLPNSSNHTHMALVKWQIPAIGHFSRIHLNFFHATNNTAKNTLWWYNSSYKYTSWIYCPPLTESFHRGKMVLWTYLHWYTSNGRMAFPLGQMAGIANVFTALPEKITFQPPFNI